MSSAELGGSPEVHSDVCRTKLVIKAQNNATLGHFQGITIDNATGFVAFASINYGYEDKDALHVTGLIGETICQLVKRTFMVWYHPCTCRMVKKNVRRY